jgi:hypothetical protein
MLIVPQSSHTAAFDGAEPPLWVRAGNPQSEQILSGLARKQTIQPPPERNSFQMLETKRNADRDGLRGECSL